MPLLIRIILQRLLIMFYSFLAFLGIAPEASIPTENQALDIIEERQEIITGAFSDSGVSERTEKLITTITQETSNIIPSFNNPNFAEIADIKLPKNATEISSKITPPKENLSSTENSFNIEDVVVNIVCQRKSGNFTNVSTGSGVVIDPEGVVITNAHVGQFMLLEDYKGESLMSCALYRENIPTFGYKADIIYISPDWVSENFDLINSVKPHGTGEDDYALLKITKNTNPTLRLPRKFSYANFSTSFNVDVDDRVTVAGYPGAPASILDISSSGVLKKDTVRIKDVFTFRNNEIDVLSTEKSIVGARGASGGGVFLNDLLVGIIVTTNGDQHDAEINAITIPYINRDLKYDTNKDIEYYLSESFSNKISDFGNKYGKELSDLLSSQI
jgi:hypothetical protein